MKFAVTGLDGVAKWAKAEVKALDVAATNAVNRTAFKVKDAQVAEMQRVFDRPTPYSLRSIFVKRSKIAALPMAEVGVIDNRTRGVPQVRYMAPQVYGGERSMKSHEKKLGFYTTPSRKNPKDAYGNVPGSFYKRVLSQLQLSSDAMQNATNSKRSKKKREAERFFIVGNVLLSQKGEALPEPMLFLIKKAPKYKPRLNFNEVAQSTYLTAFPSRFAEELRKARGR